MQTETNATEIVQPAAPIVDLNAPPPEAPASAKDAGATDVDTTVDAPVDTPTDQQTDEGSKQQEQHQGKRSNVQKRIDELTFQRSQAQREADHWRAIAEEMKQSSAPKSRDFDTDAEYEEALQNHRVESTVNKRLAANAEQTAERFSKDAAQAAHEAYNQRFADAASRIPDIATVVKAADIRISDTLKEALMDSDAGPDIVYHLAKNPAEAERLSQLSTRQIDREIGRLEVTLKAATPAKAPAARTTTAPPPIKSGQAGAAAPNTDPNKMTMPEYEAWRKANGARR